MNALDRLISVFSPQAGLRRAAARASLEGFERSYAAGQSGRRNKGWTGRGTSANVEVGQALATLRNRAREFVRDSWAGQRILDVLVSHVVGTGITVVPNTGSDRADSQFRLAYEEWQAQADLEGVLDAPTMQGLALRSMVEGGDSVIRFIDLTSQEADGSVPFRLQGLEGDQIDASRDYGLAGSNTRLGVELGDGVAARACGFGRTIPATWRCTGAGRRFGTGRLEGSLPPLPAAALGPGARHHLVRADPAQWPRGAGSVRFGAHAGAHAGLFRRLPQIQSGRSQSVRRQGRRRWRRRQPEGHPHRAGHDRRHRQFRHGLRPAVVAIAVRHRLSRRHAGDGRRRRHHL
jgi:hypothetical protein